MSDELMNTKEVAAYLGINDKQVYALIKNGRLPATRVTGKWLFPRRIIDRWIEDKARTGFEQAKEKTARISGALLASGSNDPVLDILQTCLREMHPELYIFSTNTGSRAGLVALGQGLADIAWSHLLDPETGQYNIPYLDRYAPGVNVVVVNLFQRELGFVLPKGNPLGIGSFADLVREGVRFVNRQAGSGTRLLLDYNLEHSGISQKQIKGYEHEVFTHIEVGLAVLAGDVDTGIGTAAVSTMLDLDFVPITRERFDMICSQPVFFQKGVQALIEVLASDVFRKKVERLKSYDFSTSGKIIYASGQDS